MWDPKITAEHPKEFTQPQGGPDGLVFARVTRRGGACHRCRQQVFAGDDVATYAVDDSLIEHLRCWKEAHPGGRLERVDY